MFGVFVKYFLFENRHFAFLTATKSSESTGEFFFFSVSEVKIKPKSDFEGKIFSLDTDIWGPFKPVKDDPVGSWNSKTVQKPKLHEGNHGIRIA